MKTINRLALLSLIMMWGSLLFSQPSVERVEPPNWWVGMHNPSLQLMLYGQDLAGLRPVVDHPGITVTKTLSTGNPNYLFIYLSIGTECLPGSFEIKLTDRENRQAASFSYTLQAREEGSAERKGFGPEDVLYLITPDRFANGDPGNDDIDGMPDKVDRSDRDGRHGGDIRGIVESLDYLAGMGFTAIWLNPVLENNMPRYSYHGYAATDFYRVDERFGSNAEYRDLIRQAKAKGIKVIMDMILNHCGSEHWFVEDPPTSDWINFGGEYVNTSHRRNTIQDIHASDYDKRMFSDGWFVSTMPDLNQRNPLLADYLIANTIWWIEYAGLSGIRMDTYPYPDKDFMSRWTCEVMAEYPRFNIVGEEWVTEPAIVSYWQAGKINHDGYHSCLPSLMDFPMQHALSIGLTGAERQYGSGMIRIYEMLAMDFLYPDPYQLVIFPDNHDMARFFTQVNQDPGLFRLGLACMATMRGTPQFYYGTEVLMHSSEAPDNHGLIRSDFPGGWDGDMVNAFTGEGLTDDQRMMQEYMQKLLNWRKTSKAVHEGKLMQFVPEKGIYVYFRYTDDERVMVVLNKNQETTLLRTDRFSEMLQGSLTAKEVLSGNTFNLGYEIRVPATSALILELER
jgi:glycosidase